MKRIRKVSQVSPLLDQYVVTLDRAVQNGDYERFREDCRDGHKELQASLIHVQQGLCAYCEWRIGPEGSDRFPVQIEHYVARHKAPARELDHTNMLGCCLGGADRQYMGRYQSSPDEERRDKWSYYCTDPIHENLRCGQAKDDSGKKGQKSQALDPREFPLTSSGTLPNLVAISWRTGKMTANEEGCSEVGVPAEQVNESIEALNLSSDGLCLKRKQVWRQLARKFEPETTTLHEVREQLLPDQSNVLCMFWSTVRNYFGGLAEEFLNQEEAKERLC